MWQTPYPSLLLKARLFLYLAASCCVELFPNWECSYRVKLYFGNSLHFFKAEPNICYTWHSFTNISNKSTFTVQLSMCIQFVSTLILHSLALVTPPHFSSLWTSCFYSFDIITHILVSDRPQRKEADAANLQLFFYAHSPVQTLLLLYVRGPFKLSRRLLERDAAPGCPSMS